MIRLLEPPEWEVFSIPINFYGSHPFNVIGQKILKAFKVIGEITPSDATLIDPGKVYDKLTIIYDAKPANSYSKTPWAQITFRNFYTTGYQLELNGIFTYTCYAEDFMVAAQSTNTQLGWLEREALSLECKNYFNDTSVNLDVL